MPESFFSGGLSVACSLLNQKVGGDLTIVGDNNYKDVVVLRELIPFNHSCGL